MLAKISRYMAPSNLTSICCSCPVPFTEKHPQRMMFPPPYFTVGMVFLELYSSFFILKIQRVEFSTKSHMTFSHSSSGSSRWSLANFRQAWTCAGLSGGSLHALQDCGSSHSSLTETLIQPSYSSTSRGPQSSSTSISISCSYTLP
ncbi:hypothetical protein AMECASPLE_035284 [Ameca splendens]|uniref:Uncharacterized protein n=1 Tax=Ameca splendens TaxID=208324 RepID=A0ABV1A341_9TELE